MCGCALYQVPLEQQIQACDVTGAEHGHEHHHLQSHQLFSFLYPLVDALRVLLPSEPRQKAANFFNDFSQVVFLLSTCVRIQHTLLTETVGYCAVSSIVQWYATDDELCS